MAYNNYTEINNELLCSNRQGTVLLFPQFGKAVTVTEMVHMALVITAYSNVDACQFTTLLADWQVNSSRKSMTCESSQ